MDHRQECLDGNEAAARVAYALSEVIAIYPITPASPMGEHCRRLGRRGPARTSGARCPRSSRCSPRRAPPARSTARCRRARWRRRSPPSQGLLLMIPNMFKIAGELTPAVIHVAARTHRHPRAVDLRRPQRRDGTPARPAGRCSPPARCRRRTTSRSSPTRRRSGRGCRSSTSSTASARRHEIDKIELLDDDDLRALVRDDDVARPSRPRGLTPDAPGRARHRAEPGRLLPGPRGVQPVLRSPCPGIVAGGRWTSSPARTGRRYRPRRLPRRPRRRAGDRAHGLGGGRRRGDGRRAGRGRARRSGCSRSGCTGRSRPRRSSPRCRRPCDRSPCSTAPRSRAPSASRSTWTSSPRSPRRWTATSRRSRRHAAGHRRPLRPVVEGVHAGDGQAASSTSSATPRPEAPLHRRHLRRRHRT